MEKRKGLGAVENKLKYLNFINKTLSHLLMEYKMYQCKNNLNKPLIRDSESQKPKQTGEKKKKKIKSVEN